MGMNRTWLAFMLVPIVGLLAVAQDSGSLSDGPPSDNVRGGAVRNRAPGNIVNSARAAHLDRNEARLAAQRSGDTSSLAPESDASGGGAGSVDGNALGDLIGGLLGGGSLGGSDLSGLLGGLLGGGSTGGSGTGGSTSLPPEVADLIRQFGLDPDQIFAMLDQQGTSRAISLDGLPLDRAQSTTQPSEPKFVVRWADSLLDSLFRGLTLAISTPQFRTLLQDFFEPLFPATDNGNDNDDGDNDNDNSNDNDNDNSNDNDNENSNDNDDPNS
jgi:hypothetical protein